VVRTREEVQANARRDGATEAIYRVVSMLTDGQALAATPPPSNISAPQPVQASLPAKPSDDSATASEEPYIDTFLCTSCNDCMKVNAQVFQYDANKQAYIGNARAGTFAELVKAAEGCPAKCIHPGTPRADDATATPQVRARAAKFR
jgi:ferredoxin